MLRILTATSLLALAATPALAQSDMGASTQTSTSEQQISAQPATPETPSEPGTEMGPMDSTSATPATPPAPATDSSTSAAATTAAEPRTVTVQKLVDAEFPAYDANKNKAISKTEMNVFLVG